MKYSTHITYGIRAEVLAEIPYKEALQLCKEGAIKRITQLTHTKISQDKWCNKRRMLIRYIEEARDWCKAKLEELK